MADNYISPQMVHNVPPFLLYDRVPPQLLNNHNPPQIFDNYNFLNNPNNNYPLPLLGNHNIPHLMNPTQVPNNAFPQLINNSSIHLLDNNNTPDGRYRNHDDIPRVRDLFTFFFLLFRFILTVLSHECIHEGVRERI
uniref:Uncharacterized protein n=1 Tax=Angiostrongylus cantonensis TaxID=6313 RepID=A0A0K0D7C3_ANGCA